MLIFRGVKFFFGYFMFMCDFTCLALQQGASHFCCHLQKIAMVPSLMQKAAAFFFKGKIATTKAGIPFHPSGCRNVEDDWGQSVAQGSCWRIDIADLVEEGEMIEFDTCWI